MDEILTNFEISDYLNDAEVISNYLNDVLQNGDSQELIVALGHVSKSMGMSSIAEKTGMSRTSLYKALNENAKPQFETIFKVLLAIGARLEIKPVAPAE